MESAGKKDRIINRLRLLTLLKQSYVMLRKNDPLQMAGATAFFTTFALPAILILIIQIFGLFFTPEFIGSELMQRLRDILGEDVSGQITQTLNSIGQLARNWYITVAGFIFLTFVATTLFSVIRNSFNQMWQIAITSRPGIWFGLKMRARSLVIIGLVGILFLAGVMTDSMEVFLGRNLDETLPGAGQYFQGALGKIISAIIFTVWFTILFRYLADARPSWIAALAGGIITGVLFSLGKLLLQWLLIRSNVGSIYGTSTSIVLLLLFVFYSSFILYFGAGFVKAFSEKFNKPIVPLRKAYVDEENKVAGK